MQTTKEALYKGMYADEMIEVVDGILNEKDVKEIVGDDAVLVGNTIMFTVIHGGVGVSYIDNYSRSDLDEGESYEAVSVSDFIDMIKDTMDEDGVVLQDMMPEIVPMGNFLVYQLGMNEIRFSYVKMYDDLFDEIEEDEEEKPKWQNPLSKLLEGIGMSLASLLPFKI